VLDRLNRGEEALVPGFWPVELMNSLSVGEKRGRFRVIKLAFFSNNLRHYDRLLITSSEQVFGRVQSLCLRHGLTPYDAVDVELAQRTGCPLATLDESQRRAAKALNIQCS
jgi:predicted nucleic acid-binding protein